MEKLPTQKNLLNWYIVQKELKMNEENKFWYNWEKRQLTLRRMFRLTSLTKALKINV